MSNTFCVYPFIHLATLTNGNIVPCCMGSITTAKLDENSSIRDVWNSTELKDIRIKMLNNQQVPNCSQCYKDEENGVSSHRIQSNEFYNNNFKEELDNALNSVDVDGSISVLPFTLDIRAGNTCNLKCIMCKPEESSKWLSDANKIHEITNDNEIKLDWKNKLNIDTRNFTWVEREEFWEDFKTLIPNLKEIIFGGGEPFLSKSINNSIQYMVDSGYSKNIKLRFHTNGTQIPETFWPLVSKFREIDMFFSLDGLSDHNYYLRYPADWNEIVKNLNLADQTTARTMILSSLSSLSMYNIVDLYRWRLEQPFKNINNIPIILGRVYAPSYLNPQGLPEPIRLQYHKRIMNFIDEYKDLYEPTYFDNLKLNAEWVIKESDLKNHHTLIEYIKNLDEVRGTSFAKTFPNLNKILHNENNNIR